MDPHPTAVLLTVTITLLCGVKMWLCLGDGHTGDATFFFLLTAVFGCVALDLGIDA